MIFIDNSRVKSILDDMFAGIFDNMPTVYFSKINSDAIVSSKINENAGYDIYSNFKEDYIIIPPHETKLTPTGIASAFSDDYYLQIKERGSTGINGMGIRAGVVDSGFRGEIKVVITNHNNVHLVIAKKGITVADVFGEVAPSETIFYPYEKAIAQLVLLPVPKVQVKEISYDDLLNIKSERGADMLGASGK